MKRTVTNIDGAEQKYKKIIQIKKKNSQNYSLEENGDLAKQVANNLQLG